MIERYLYSELSAIATTFGGQAPPSTQTPYIVFKQVSGNPSRLDADTDAQSDRWQVDSYAGSDYTAGRDQARRVIQALDKSGFFNAVCIYSVQVDGPQDEYDQDVEQHYQSLDFIIHYSE